MSLLRIALKDFVIVRALDLDLAGGFSVLTGETGAGKSILIDALQLALGGRADAGVVRPGQPKADVSAEFQLTPEATAWLTEQELNGDEPTVLVRRTVDAQGRSKGWINGNPVTAGQLKELAALLVDIHGQHAWQALTNPQAVRDLLDDYAGIDCAPLAELWREWKAALQTLQLAQTDQANLQQKKEQLEWKLAEWDKLRPQQGEWDRLQTDHKRLANMHHLLDAASAASQCLADGEANALSLANHARQQLEARVALEPAFEPLMGLLEQSALLQHEVARALHSYTSRTEADPQRLNELDQRLAQWMDTARRLNCPPDKLHDTGLELQAALAALDQSTRLHLLEERVNECYNLFKLECEKISALRHQYKHILATEITKKIHLLGMPGGRFEVVLQPLSEPQTHGLEAVEFHVAGHAGVEPRPIGKVASGGELSRVALAISVCTSQLKGCPTLIFDEVDSGVGGAVAHTVGQLMAELGQHRQVLAVTHLPQVAACAHHHYQVEKTNQNGEVLSQVTGLDATQRVEELARMLGGATVTEASRAHAREMLQA